MNLISIITSLLVISGIGVMTASIFLSKVIPRIFQQVTTEKNKKIDLFLSLHQILMVFFFFGYLVVLYAFIMKIEIISNLLVGIIFSLGAVFVLLGVQLQSRMLASIRTSFQKAITMSNILERERVALLKTNEKLNLEMEGRKRMENALEASEIRLKTILDNLQAAVMIIDNKTHEIVDVNIMGAKMIGNSREKILHKICHQFVCPAEEGKCPISDLEQCVDNSERILIRSDGRQIPIIKTVIPITLNDQQFLIESFIDITQRKIDEEKIKTSLKEKEVLLKEIHHRVKNNLQIISSFLRLQSGHLKDEDALKMFKDSQNRIQTMALIHERLYQSKDLARINFPKYVESLVAELHQTYMSDHSRVELEVNVKDVSLLMEEAIPCGLVINELVSNCWKHAFPPSWKKQGKINISVRSIDTDEIELIVKDNGIGFPKNVDFRKTESLGMHLVTTLVENQLEGNIRLEKRAGTEFQISFKRKQRQMERKNIQQSIIY